MKTIPKTKKSNLRKAATRALLHEIEHHLELGVELKASFQLVRNRDRRGGRGSWRATPVARERLVKSLSLEAATSPPIILAGLEQRTSLPESSVATAAHFDQIWQVCGTWAVAYFCSPDDGMPPPLLRPVNESVWLETIQISCMQRSWLRAYTDVLTSNLLRPHAT